MTPTRWLDAWLTSRQGVLNATTIASYERNIRRRIIPHLGKRKLRSLTGMELTGFYARLDLSPKTIQIILHKALVQAEKEGLIADNPVTFAELHSVHRKQVLVPGHDEITRVLQANAGRWESTAIIIMLGAGLRRGETVGLRWTDIDGGRIRVARNIQVLRGELLVRPQKSDAGIREVAVSAGFVAHLGAYSLLQRKDALKTGLRIQDGLLVPLPARRASKA